MEAMMMQCLRNLANALECLGCFVPVLKKKDEDSILRG